MAELTIISYNIHSCIGTDGIYSPTRIAHAITQCGSHIICLQEVEVNPSNLQTRVWSHPHHDNQVQLLAKLAGYTYHEFAPAIHSKASRWKETHKSVSNENKTNAGFGKFGIAILSKYPIITMQIHRFRRYKRKTLRNAMACLVKLPDRSLVWIVNTHLGCHFIGGEQAQQVKELVLFINSLDRNGTRGVVLCGDFNAPPLYSCIRYMKCCGLRDLWKYHGRGWGGTFPLLRMPLFCGSKLLRLDYIFIMEFDGIAMDCKYIHVQDSGDSLMASDHLPLCAVLVLGQYR